MSIRSVVDVMLLSCRSKIAGYADKEYVLCCWLHTSTNVATWGGGAVCVSVRLFGVGCCVALTLGVLCVIFCTPDFLDRSLGVVAPGFSATRGLVFVLT